MGFWDGFPQLTQQLLLHVISPPASVQLNTCTSIIICHYQLLTHTSSCALTSAPASSSACTTGSWPCSLAWWRGVPWTCKTHSATEVSHRLHCNTMYMTSRSITTEPQNRQDWHSLTGLCNSRVQTADEYIERQDVAERNWQSHVHVHMCIVGKYLVREGGNSCCTIWITDRN